MAGDTGAPGFIPLYDDDTSFAPIQDPFNGISQALNAALKKSGYTTYATLATLNLPANAGTVVGQHATVNADSTATNNGDYVWSGSAWLAAGTNIVEAALPAFGTGWTAQTGVNAPRLKMLGKLVTAFGAFNWAGGGAYNAIATAPAPFRPTTSTAGRDIGVIRQVTSPTLNFGQAVLNGSTGVIGTGSGATASFPASGAVFLSGLSWWID